ncbi:transposase [Neisseria gonorrhoeae NG-k51.05]|nr:transposase [Neisseria gonorrhoeae NG-k51.05]
MAAVNQNTAACYFLWRNSVWHIIGKTSFTRIWTKSAKLWRHTTYRLRLLIRQNSPHLEMYDGEAGAGESYFRKGRRGRSAAGKAAVFGLLKRNGKVCTVTVGHSNRYFIAYYPRTGETRQHCLYGLFVVTMYQIVSGFGRFRINRGTHFAERQNHINAIGNFWNRANVICASLTAFPKSISGCI